MRERRTAAAESAGKKSPFDKKATRRGGGHWMDGSIIGGGAGGDIHWLVMCILIQGSIQTCYLTRNDNCFLIRYTNGILHIR